MEDCRLLDGRQVYFLILQELQTPKVEDNITGLHDLFTIELLNDDLRKFNNDWDAKMFAIPDAVMPNEPTLEHLYRAQLKNSTQFQPTMQLYELKITQDDEKPSLGKLKQMVVRFLNEKRHAAPAPRAYGYVAEAGRPRGAQQGDCNQWYKNGKCSREDCPWKHEKTIAPDGGLKTKKGKSKGGKGGKFGAGKSKRAPQSRSARAGLQVSKLSNLAFNRSPLWSASVTTGG
jgi:hypothetical protein